MKEMNCIEKYPVIMTVSDIADFLEKSDKLTYMIAQQRGFPSVKLGGRVLVFKMNFKIWLEGQYL